jgi:hypothetical protein
MRRNPMIETIFVLLLCICAVSALFAILGGIALVIEKLWERGND